MIKMFEFVDLDNNEYFYNNDTGMIFPKLYSGEFENLQSCKIADINKGQIQQIEEFADVLNNNTHTWNQDLLTDNYYVDNGIKQLTFKLTNQCNLRCKYCTYSNHYKNTDTYNDEVLDFETSVKAIDIYMGYIEDHNRVNNGIKVQPHFTFYGGEPLLQYELIARIVEYIKDKYKDFVPQYLMTTNGVLLNQERADFLKDNKFFLSLSIDGYLENHDRNRVSQEDKGTFNQINNLVNKYLKDYDKWNIFMCYDILTDFNRLKSEEDFGDGSDWFFKKIAKVTPVMDINTDYYDQFSDTDINEFRNNFRQMRENYIRNKIENNPIDIISSIIYDYEFIMLDDRQKFRFGGSFYETPIGNCIPGDKLFLQTDGTFTLCEKVPNFPELIIGDIDNGIDIKKVQDLIRKINKDLLINCKSCEISKLCMFCYSILEKDDKNKITINPDVCESQKTTLRNKLGNYVYLKTKNPDVFNRFFIDKYISGIYG